MGKNPTNCKKNKKKCDDDEDFQEKCPVTRNKCPNDPTPPPTTTPKVTPPETTATTATQVCEDKNPANCKKNKKKCDDCEDEKGEDWCSEKLDKCTKQNVIDGCQKSC